MCGRRILARLWIRAWLNPESSRNRASFCSSMILFSSSMFFRFFSMLEICRAKNTWGYKPVSTLLRAWARAQRHKPATGASPWLLPSPSWTRSAHWSPCSAAWSPHRSLELWEGKWQAVSLCIWLSMAAHQVLTFAFTSSIQNAHLALFLMFCCCCCFKNLTIVILCRSICKCKSEQESCSWSPEHSCALQSWPP